MKIPFTAFIAIGCFSMAAIPASFAQAAKDKPSAKPPAAAKEKTEKKDDAKADESAEEAKPEGTTIDENSVLGRMAKTVQGYFAAKSPREKLTFVLSPEQTEPLMRDFYFREPLTPGALTGITNPEAVAINGLSYWRTNFTLSDGRQGTVFMRLVDDTPKIDWPSEVRYSTINWDDWLKNNDGKVADFRVLTQVDSYYAKDFSDRSKYLCLKVNSSGSPNSIFAYLDLTDMDQLEFAQSLMNGQAKDCVLSLKLVKGDAKFPIATVEKVISPTWLVTEAGK